MALLSQHQQETKEIREFTTLPIDRLQQLGYQCQTERCDAYTTLMIRPVDESPKAGEFMTELLFNDNIKEQHN